MNTKRVIIFVSLLICALLSACGLSPSEKAATVTQEAANNFATLTAHAPTATPTVISSPTVTATPNPTATPTATPTPRPTNTPEPTLTPTKGLSSIALVLDDLPAGFKTMPAEQVSVMEQAYPKGSSVFGFADDERSQVLIGVLIPYLTRADQATFDSVLPQFVQIAAAGVGADTNSMPLPGVDDIGKIRAGITAVAKMGSLSLRWDIFAFRRGEVGVLVLVAYPDGDQSAMPIVDLAQLLDERIQNFLAANE